MIKRTRQLCSGVVALLLVAVALWGVSGSSTWANPPTQAPPIEPFSFQLEHPPSGGTLIAADATVQPMAGGDWSTLTSSGFEQDFQSEGWEVQGAGWARSSTQKNSGSYSAAVENFSGTPITWLIYSFSLDDVADARLNFSYWLDTDTDTYLGWAASADGVSFYGARTSGRVGAWLSGSLDLKHLAGDDSVWIAFVISGDGSGSGQNVFVDDVTITAQEPYRVHLPLAYKNYVPPFPDFDDDFSDAGSGWPRKHVDNLPDYEEHRDYVSEYGSTYKMKLGGYTWFHRIFASPEDVHSRDEFTLQANIMYDYGDYRAGWGLILEASDDMKTYYLAGVYRYGGNEGSDSGMFCHIRKVENGTEQDLVATSAPDYFERSKGEWTTIRVVRQENSISLYAVNSVGQWENIISTSNTPSLSGDRVGFSVFNAELGADGWFDDFHLWQRPIIP